MYMYVVFSTFGLSEAILIFFSSTGARPPRAKSTNDKPSKPRQLTLRHPVHTSSELDISDRLQRLHVTTDGRGQQPRGQGHPVRTVTPQAAATTRSDVSRTPTTPNNSSATSSSVGTRSNQALVQVRAMASQMQWTILLWSQARAEPDRTALSAPTLSRPDDYVAVGELVDEGGEAEGDGQQLQAHDLQVFAGVQQSELLDGGLTVYVEDTTVDDEHGGEAERGAVFS